MILGVDTGGTFTDFVLVRNEKIVIHKVLSTPAAPEQAILQGIVDLGLADIGEELLVIHGSTVATNAALEGKGVRTVFITNRGFKDMLTIGRQARQDLYDLQPAPLAPPVPESLCLETGGRLNADGQVLEILSPQDIEIIQRQVAELAPEAVAINLLYSYLDDSNEKAIEAALPEHIFVARSSRVLPEYKEYERGIATWLNAWLGPRVEGYIKRLQQALDPVPVAIMQSSGGTMSADQAAGRAVNMLLSGPAGGLAGVQFIGDVIEHRRLISFDMGGTSTDVALLDGSIRLTNEGYIGRWPVAVPMVDMQTIGAGGGSLAYLDSGGMLHVGPQSAGADPGPACYGNGGTQPTVTDANVVLGRLRAGDFLGGAMKLDPIAAETALNELAESLGLSAPEAAEGIVRLANEHMGRALRAISVERGYDPSDFILCCFGGAGGLHVCDLADNLKLQQALIPVHAGVLSALGMLVAPKERQLAKTLRCLLAEASPGVIAAGLQQLAQRGTAELAAEDVDASQIVIKESLDLRYRGQSYTLSVPWQGSIEQLEYAFHRAHEARYGHIMARPVELVNLRSGVSAPASQITLPAALQQEPKASYTTVHGVQGKVPLLQRAMLSPETQYDGPLLITEQVSTTWVKPGWRVTRDSVGNLLLERRKR